MKQHSNFLHDAVATMWPSPMPAKKPGIRLMPCPIHDVVGIKVFCEIRCPISEIHRFSQNSITGVATTTFHGRVFGRNKEGRLAVPDDKRFISSSCIESSNLVSTIQVWYFGGPTGVALRRLMKVGRLDYYTHDAQA